MLNNFKTSTIRTFSSCQKLSKTSTIALGSIILALVVSSYYLAQTNATKSDSVQTRGISGGVYGEVSKVSKEDSKRLSKGVIKPYKQSEQSDKECLKEALWYEARGTSKKELEMISDVIINRAKANSSSICKEIKKDMQFSYRNSRSSISEPRASNKIEEKALDEIQKVVNTRIKGQGIYKSSLPIEVQYYARKDIKNYWTKKKKSFKIASNDLKHKFYY